MRRFAGILAVSSLGLAAVASPLTGYLPVVGPTPLRFQAPPVPVDLSLLPPLAMTDAKPPVANDGGPARLPMHLQTVIDMFQWMRTNVSVSPVQSLAPLQLAATNAVPTNTLPALDARQAAQASMIDTNDQPAMSPQMLLHFFKQRGNRPGQNTVVVPQGFTPPPPAAPRSSTATFNTP